MKQIMKCVVAFTLGLVCVYAYAVAIASLR